MKIHVIIPNYNGSHLLHKNLPAVMESVERRAAEITVIDDHSEEQDFDAVNTIAENLRKEYRTPIHVIRNGKNLGFSAAVNRAAFSRESDILVLLNTDVKPQKDFLESPLKILSSDDNVFGVGSMDKSIEDGKEVLRGRGVGSFKSGFLIHKKGEVNRDDTLWISGGSCVIRTELFKKIGGFDELYSPFYWEDIDLSYRALKYGYKIYFDSKSVVVHRHEEGAIKSNFSQDDVQKIAYRNQFIFVWKNITDGTYVVQHLLYIPLHLIKAILRGDMNYLTGFFRAFVLLPKILAKRRIVKKYTRKKDGQILKEH